MTTTKLTTAQIAQIKTLDAFSKSKFHGNTKRVGSLTVSLVQEIVAKKYNRRAGNYVAKNGKVIMSYEFKKAEKRSYLEVVKSCLELAKQTAGTSYFKIMIEGNTGIYLASPDYGHADYNKCRVFDKNEKTLRLMNLYNSIVSKY